VIINPFMNPSSGTFDPGSGAWISAGVPNIGGIGVVPMNQNYGKVSAFTNNAHSNYNALQVNLRHNGHGVAGQVNYTWSHSLDDISNGGTGLPWNGGSVTDQVSPNLFGPFSLNYSNSDYDIRHNVTGDIVYQEPYKSHYGFLDVALAGWSIGGKVFYRTGEPYSITSNQISDYTQLGTVLMAETNTTPRSLRNLAPNHPHGCVATPSNPTASCLDNSQYTQPFSGPGTGQTTFGNLRRNALYGPHYFNTDMSLLKDLFKHERMTLAIGANAYNVFNHANFANPGSTVGSSTFGVISGVQAPPTSPYGSFQGAAVTQRVLVVHGRFTF
jgi:hypothetical protein